MYGVTRCYIAFRLMRMHNTGRPVGSGQGLTVAGQGWIHLARHPDTHTDRGWPLAQIIVEFRSPGSDPQRLSVYFSRAELVVGELLPLVQVRQSRHLQLHITSEERYEAASQLAETLDVLHSGWGIGSGGCIPGCAGAHVTIVMT